MKILRMLSTQRILVPMMCITIAGLAIFFWSHHMPRSGTLLLLNGTSSSGKSAILNSFQKKHPDFKVFKIDDWFPNEMKQTATQLGWQENSGMDPWIFLAMYVEQKTGKPNFDTETRAYLFQGTAPMYAAAKKALQDGQNVVIDTVFEYDPEYQKFSDYFAGFNNIKIIVYCPLDILLERVQARNSSGVQAERRTAFQSFEQFPAMYKLQDHAADEVIVDTVSASSMKNALQAAIQELTDNKIPDKYLPRLQEFEQHFIKQFKLDEQNQITLVARHQYDLILNSGKYTSDELVLEIDESLK